MRAQIETDKFMRDMNNVIKYSYGFLDGVNSGKKKFLNNLGLSTIEAMKEFVDSMARVDAELLHHVYEWGMVGSPNARLFDIEYTINNYGLSIGSTFRQSQSIQDGSGEPFYNKAKVMEDGVPITIRPKKAKVLHFVNDSGEDVFTSNDIIVQNPGGPKVAGGYEKVFDLFMNQYFSQAFLNVSGILDKLKDISIYKKNFALGSKMGKMKGREIGYRWITNAGVMK